MKHFAILFVALTLIAAIPSTSSADTIRLTDWNTAGNFAANAAGGGGPFVATPISGTSAGTTAFLTFCLEYTEHFYYNTVYNFALSDAARLGGGGATGTPPSDPVSDATKWLYYEARFGGYTSWYQTATGINPVGSSNVGANIQHAIWVLEQEAPPGPTTPAGSAIANWALLHSQDVVGGWADLYSQGHRVYAMNLTDSSGNAIQDQLAYAPVPEPASMLLFGTGLVAAAGAARRRMRKP